MAELTISRNFNAPPERVYDAWAQREDWGQWIGPEGVTCRIESMDPVVGGRYFLVMEIPDGSSIRVTGQYLVMDRPKRLVFTWDGVDAVGTSTVTLIFEADGNGTRMQLHHADIEKDHVAPMDHGWQSALNKLERFTEGVLQ